MTARSVSSQAAQAPPQDTQTQTPPASATPAAVPQLLETPISPEEDAAAVPGEQQEVDSKTGKPVRKKIRNLLGLGQKNKDGASTAEKEGHTKSDQLPELKTPTSTPAMNLPPQLPMTPASQQGSPPLSGADARLGFSGSPPLGGMSPPLNAASPSRRLRSSSPRLHSPASSMIFERNVQEQAVPDDMSTSIPNHIQTEDRIPPVLEASSLAITDDHLNPDEVEIVMHSAHTPAAATIAGGAGADSTPYSPTPRDREDVRSSTNLDSYLDSEETASNYGSLDTHDVRRLSFISFADVVQAEHTEQSQSLPGNRDSMLLQSLSNTATNRSPSPIRSPASSHGISPPTSGAPSMKGIEIPSSKAAGPRSPPAGTTQMPGTQSPPLASSGELHVETMRQALKHTGSQDLSGAKSPSVGSGPLSAVSNEDGEHGFR